MPGMRVHELAKEFDMTSKELLDRLAEMKIPAKSHASILQDAYVQKVRKNLEQIEQQKIERKEKTENELLVRGSSRAGREDDAQRR
jgi:translation initiation factor IF-2